MRVWVRDREFVCSLRGHAWQAADGLLAVDGTVEIEARSVQQEVPDVLGLIHGRLVRSSLDGAFMVPLSPEEIGELVRDAQDSEAAFDAQASDCEGMRIRVPDARFRITGCRVPVTAAPPYPGGARAVLESRFALGSADWMQDWPLEVSDAERVEEFTSFYDEVDDPAVRFDVMQLALFSYDERAESRLLTEWFQRTLRRDFALHGHTVAEWAELERESEDPELQRSDPEFVFRISGMLRRIWDASLWPVPVERALTSRGPSGGLR